VAAKAKWQNMGKKRNMVGRGREKNGLQKLFSGVHRNFFEIFGTFFCFGVLGALTPSQ
jgi:hypothetical protein